jgi:D-alanyl-lipoteichoic acid acyltransferase DltB (MBOAT superfamily)
MKIDLTIGIYLVVGIYFIFISVVYLLRSRYKSENKEHARKLKFLGSLGLLTGIILTFSTIILGYI